MKKIFGAGGGGGPSEGNICIELPRSKGRTGFRLENAETAGDKLIILGVSKGYPPEYDRLADLKGFEVTHIDNIRVHTRDDVKRTLIRGGEFAPTLVTLVKGKAKGKVVYRDEGFTSRSGLDMELVVQQVGKTAAEPSASGKISPSASASNMASFSDPPPFFSASAAMPGMPASPSRRAGNRTPTQKGGRSSPSSNQPPSPGLQRGPNSASARRLRASPLVGESPRSSPVADLPSQTAQRMLSGTGPFAVGSPSGLDSVASAELVPPGEGSIFAGMVLTPGNRALEPPNSPPTRVNTIRSRPGVSPTTGQGLGVRRRSVGSQEASTPKREMETPNPRGPTPSMPLSAQAMPIEPVDSCTSLKQGRRRKKLTADEADAAGRESPSSPPKKAGTFRRKKEGLSPMGSMSAGVMSVGSERLVWSNRIKMLLEEHDPTRADPGHVEAVLTRAEQVSCPLEDAYKKLCERYGAEDKYADDPLVSPRSRKKKPRQTHEDAAAGIASPTTGEGEPLQQSHSAVLKKKKLRRKGSEPPEGDGSNVGSAGGNSPTSGFAASVEVTSLRSEPSQETGSNLPSFGGIASVGSQRKSLNVDDILQEYSTR
eukprot:Hpha_TRINITY_DN15873_c1_g3::TRINITY_DN15873_c1_g3_i2::g.189780::m.189780